MREAKILFLAANPASSERLSLDEEVRDVRERIQRRSCTVSLDLESHWAVRPADVQRLLNELRPDVVHFSGHGGGASGLMFHSGKRSSKLVDGPTLRELFKLFREHVRVVVLNACYSRAQAREISKEIDWVVGMNRAVGDKAAVEFAGGFYQALAYGQGVRNAVEQGRIAMKLDGLNGRESPCLLIRRGAASDLILGKPVNGHRRPTISGRRDVGTLPSTACIAEGQRRYVIRLEASLADMNPELVNELTKLLRESTGDMMLTIEKIEEGSVILTIATTEAGGVRLVELRETGRFEELAGLKVTSVGEQAAASPSDGSIDEAVHCQHVELCSEAKFRAIIVEHLPALRSRARQLCRSHVDAEDLVQEALLRALRARCVNDSSRMRAWLLRILTDTFSDMLRRTSRRQIPNVVVPDVTETGTEPPTEPLPWSGITDEEARAAVAGLTDDVRTTYRMFALENRSYSEIARLLGIPTSTVGTRILRAYQQLRVILAKQAKQSTRTR
jgi:RNA polymerase sigma factor (sigma-70 family)